DRGGLRRAGHAHRAEGGPAGEAGGGPGPSGARGGRRSGGRRGKLLPHGARGCRERADDRSEGVDRGMTKQEQHVLAVLVENRVGVLSRVAGMFSRRGFNIDSINVGQTEDPRYSRMTIVVRGSHDDLEQVSKQLHKLIDVIKVSDLTEDDMVERELALVKVSAGPENRTAILQIVDIFRARIIDVSE